MISPAQEDIERWWQRPRQWGQIDILVNNAGYNRPQTAVELPKNWDKTLNINLKGLFFTARRCLR